MPRGTLPTGIVAVTVRVARSITDRLPARRLVIQSSVPRGCTATPQGPSPTGTVAETVRVARSTSDTVSSRKLLTAAMPKLAWHASQRPPRHTSSPLHTLPSLQLVPSGSIWHVGEQQSPAAVLPSSHVSPASRTPSPQTGMWTVVVVVVVVDVTVELVLVEVVVVDVLVELVVDDVVLVDVLVEVVVVDVVVGGGGGDGTQSSRRWIRVRSSLPKRLRVKTYASPKLAAERVL